MSLAGDKFTPSYFTHTFANGLRLFGCHAPSQSPERLQTSIAVQVGAGLRDEPEGQEGVSILLARMLLAGTERFEKEQLAAAFAGLDNAIRPVQKVNFAINDEFVRYSAAFIQFSASNGPWLTNPRVQRWIELIADVLRRPTLPWQELDSARDELRAAIRHHGEMWRPQYTARRHLFAGTGLGRSDYGDDYAVGLLAPDDLWAFWRARYRPANTLIAVVGDFEWSALLDWVGAQFGDWAGGTVDVPRARPRPRTEVLVEPRDDHRSDETESFAVAVPFPPYGDQDHYAAALVSFILGGYTGLVYPQGAVDGRSRLISEVRTKRELVGPIFGSYEPNATLGALVVDATTEVRQAPRAVQAIVNELRRLGREGVAAEELNRAREHVRNELDLGVLRALGGRAQITHLSLLGRAWWDAGRPVTLDEIEDAINAVSREQVLGMLRRFPLLEPLVLVGVGPLAAEELLGAPSVTSIPAYLARQDAAAERARPPETLADGTVYVAAGEHLLAVDGRNGVERWRRPGPLLQLTLAGNVLFGRRPEGVIEAVRTSDGATLWQAEVAASAFTVGEGLVGGVTTAGEAFTLRAEDGAPLWHTERGGYSHLQALAGEMLLVQSKRENPPGAALEALRLADGTVRWVYAWRYDRSFDWRQGERMLLTLSEGRVYLSLFDDFVQALDVESGQPVWRCWLSTDVFAAPVARDSTVYVGSNGRLFALRAEDGAALWRHVASTEHIHSYSIGIHDLLLHAWDLAADDERAYLTVRYTAQHHRNSDDDISTAHFAVSLADGEAVWSRTGATRFLLGSDGTVICPTNEGREPGGPVSVVAAGDGVFLWEREEREATFAGLGRSTIYVVSAGALHALKAEDGAPRWEHVLDGMGLDAGGAIACLIAE
jgi:predicted Zn-dependent peptidase/outer membrane protein assembly factor BamB